VNLLNATAAKITEAISSVASVDRNLYALSVSETIFFLNQQSAVNEVNLQQTLQREAF